MVRGLIQELLESQGYSVISAPDAAAARFLAATHLPQVLVADIQLGSGPTGIDLAHVVTASQKLEGLVFLTNLPEPRLIGFESKSIPKRAVYLNKSRLASSGVLVKAIEASRSGRVDASLRDDLNVISSLPDLSKSQIDVLRMVADGLSNQEIAERRGTGLRAVENLLHRAYESMGIDVEAGSGNIRVNAALTYLKAIGQSRG